METTLVSEFKATLSEQLARVKVGEEVVVTERGRLIAKTVPLSVETLGLSYHMSGLARKGLTRLGIGKIRKICGNCHGRTIKADEAYWLCWMNGTGVDEILGYLGVLDEQVLTSDEKLQSRQ